MATVFGEQPAGVLPPQGHDNLVLYFETSELDDAARPFDPGRRSGVLRLGPPGCVELPARSTRAGHRIGMDDVPPRARIRDRRAPRHPTDGHPDVSPRRRLLHRRDVHTCPAAAGAGGHVPQPLEAGRRVEVGWGPVRSRYRTSHGRRFALGSAMPGQRSACHKRPGAVRWRGDTDLCRVVAVSRRGGRARV